VIPPQLISSILSRTGSCLPQEFFRGHVPRRIEGPDDGIIGHSAVEIPKDSKEYEILCNVIAQPRLSSVSARRCFPANRSLWIFQERTTACYICVPVMGICIFKTGLTPEESVPPVVVFRIKSPFLITTPDEHAAGSGAGQGRLASLPTPRAQARAAEKPERRRNLKNPVQ
jgi:hypothetical protein